MGRRRSELTPLLLLFSWSFCQAGFTGQQPIRLHCDNCIFAMKKKIQTQFHKEKKNQKSSFQNMENPANKDFDFTLRLASLAEAVLSMFLQVSVRYCCVVSQSLIKKIQWSPYAISSKIYIKSNKLAYKIYFFKIRKLLTEFLLLQRLCFLEEQNQKSFRDKINKVLKSDLRCL